jgi:hypothetical protein
MNANVAEGYNISFSVSWDSATYSLNVSCSGLGNSFRFLTNRELSSKTF